MSEVYPKGSDFCRRYGFRLRVPQLCLLIVCRPAGFTLCNADPPEGAAKSIVSFAQYEN